jgi:hypothetical protein
VVDDIGARGWSVVAVTCVVLFRALIAAVPLRRPQPLAER